MRMLLSAAIPAFFLVLTNSALAQPEPSFPNASETVPELIELWEQSNSTCRGAAGDDVETAAACLSRSVYGLALNERDWCLGREGEANADMTWHGCGADSMRFPSFEMPPL